jgi:hypothetical protein
MTCFGVIPVLKHGRKTFGTSLREGGPPSDNLLRGDPGIARVDANTIESFVAQPSGSRAIHVVQADNNASPVSYVEFNMIANAHFPTDIEVLASSPNSGIIPSFLVRGNILGAAVVTRTEGSTHKSIFRMADNYTTSQAPFPSAVPTSGKWDVGQIIYFSAPSAGGYIGAVCVTAGSPGTWKNFGAIAP